MVVAFNITKEENGTAEMASSSFFFFPVVLIHMNSWVSHLPFLSALSLAARRDSQSKAVFGRQGGIMNQNRHKGFYSHKAEGDHAPQNSTARISKHHCCLMTIPALPSVDM